MPTQEDHLLNFFSSYECRRYTYDPTNDPTDEFERLCIARQWGKARKEENSAKFTLATHRATRNSSPAAIFFRKYEFSRFVHNPLADPVAEFDRLQAAKDWEEKDLVSVRGEFLAALGGKAVVSAKPAGKKVTLERLPIVEFLKGQEFSRYDYLSGRPEEEFKWLVKAHRGIWEEEERRMGRALAGDEGWRRWRVSTRFTELQEGFHKAVEEQFDLMLDKIASETRLRRDEVMAELYGVGKAPLSKAEARTALESVHVNIFDFLEVVYTTINTATDHGKQNLIRLLSPGARALNFPDDAMLAIYGRCMDRVFPRERAKSGGTLILLLRPIFGDFERVFKGFKSEGGRDFDKAKDKGPDVMRELLLSREWKSLWGVKAIRNKPLAGPHRSRG